MFKSTNPYSLETIAEFEPERDPAGKVKAAHRAYAAWCGTSAANRKQLILAFAAVLEKRKEEYARMITLEMGKLFRESVAEVEKCIVTTRFYAEEADRYLQPVEVPSSHDRAFYAFEPQGVILAIMPWNFPFWQVLRFAVPNLLLGNTVILKHASNVLGSAAHIESAFREAGFPEGAFQAINLSSSHIETLISDPLVKGVTLTGSGPAGASVASLAGKYLKKSVLELGGSDPFVVLNDAQQDLAAETAVKSRFQNAGQTCIAAKRWIVENGVYDTFREKILHHAGQLHPGDPLDPATTLAPVARLDLAETLENQVKDLVSRGAVPLMPQERHNCLLAPQVMEVSRELAAAYREEVFGPVGFLVRAKDAGEAVAIANETPFGLGASLWTSDTGKGLSLMQKINAGSVFLNSMVKSEGAVPFGGTAESGYGRELGSFGMHEFANIKSYVITQ
ncbi:NAD-dependent succinate-semialdehyde dehydrogenase [Leadbetterella sp. DM7]|uniref:NAD-dependent succinate-semialdehyde dehydrogenase n=1 Tax=Leadbetterella sp. DM7 TaxID=3235085 RepID=UPI00349E5F45